MQLLQTDDQVIARIRKWQPYRRPVGFVCFVLGIIAVAFVLYWVNDLHSKSLALFADLDPSRTLTTQQVQESFDHARFNVGFGLGFAFATGLSAGASLATSGFVLLVSQSRKDRLLLQCWDGRSAAS